MTRLAGPQTTTPPLGIDGLNRLVRATRRRLRASWLLTGLALTLGTGLVALLTAVGIDLVLPLSTTLRAVALALIVGPILFVLALGVVRPLLRRLGMHQVARRIERRIPNMHNRLVTAIDLGMHPDQPGVSEAFRTALLRDTARKVEGFRPAAIVDRQSVLRALLFSGAAIALFAAIYLLLPEYLQTTIARLIFPWADIPPAARVVLAAYASDKDGRELKDGRTLKGDDVVIVGEATRGSLGELELQLTGAKGKTVNYPMEQTGEREFKFVVNTVNEPYRYRVVGGGTWSRLARLTPVERPIIRDLHTELHYPGYMGIAQPLVGPAQAGSVRGPVGSQIDVVVRSQGNVARGELQFLEERTETIRGTKLDKRDWFGDTLPPGAVPEGAWNWDAGTKRYNPRAHTEPAGSGHRHHGFTKAAKKLMVHPGDMLFANVYIDPAHMPREIMLKWHDGTNWNHRAYWGENVIPFGANPSDKTSHQHLGGVPLPARWVTLEVPAEAVGLAGKEVDGISFDLYDGHVYWDQVGVSGVRETTRTTLVPTRRVPLQSAGTDTWSGRFDLVKNDQYTVVLFNELDAPSKGIKESKVVALPDLPPQVLVERPGADLVLSEPAKVPLVVRAFDDWALAEITLLTHQKPEDPIAGVPLKTIAGLSRSETIATALDLPSLNLKKGDTLRYQVEVRDKKGQLARTTEFSIRIGGGAESADTQLENLTKFEETAKEKLTKLIGAQTTINEKLAKLSERAEKLPHPRTAEKDPTQKGIDPKKAPPKPLDPAQQVEAAKIRQDLAAVQNEQNQALSQAQQIANDLQQSAAQAAQNKLIPEATLKQMKAVQEDFEQRGVEAMKNALEKMQQQANAAKNPSPDVKPVAQTAQPIPRDLESIGRKMDAIERSNSELTKDSEKAMQQLDQDVQAEDAKDAMLKTLDLSKYMDELQAKLAQLRKEDQQLAKTTEVAPESMRSELEKQTDELEANAKDPLEEAKELLRSAKMEDLKGKKPRDYPNAPYTPPDDEKTRAPGEEDTEEEEMPNAKDKAKDASQKKDQDEDEEPADMPNLGARPIDPRFADKMRPLAKKAGDPKDAEHEHAGEHPDPLNQRQQALDHRLSRAEQRLNAQQGRMSRMMEQIRDALEHGQPLTPEQMAALMQSAEMRQALQMSAAMRQMQQQNQQGRAQSLLDRLLAQRGQHDPTGRATTPPGRPEPFRSNGVDLKTESALMKLQPKLREELLQGLREQGPAAYQKFVDEYFTKLTETPNGK